MAIEIKQTIKYEDVINALKSKLNTNIQVDFENFLNDNGLGISSNKKAVVNKLTVLNLCSAVALFISKKYQINLNTEQIVYNKNLLITDLFFYNIRDKTYNSTKKLAVFNDLLLTKIINAIKLSISVLKTESIVCYSSSSSCSSSSSSSFIVYLNI